MLFTLYAWQYSTTSMDEEPTQIGVTSLTDAKQLCFPSRRMLPRNQTEPGCQIAAFAEGCTVSDCSRKGSRGQCSNARYRKQPATTVYCFCRLGQFPVYSFDLLFQILPLTSKLDQKRSHPWRQEVFGVFENGRDLSLEVSGACSDSNTVLQEKPSDLVDHSSSPPDPSITHTVQSLKIQLRLVLDWNEPHGRPLHSLSDRFRIDVVILI